MEMVLKTMIGPLSVLYLILGFAGFALYLYMVYPIVLIHIYFKLSVWLCGMRLKYIDIDGLRICYGEKGKRKKGHPSIILVHGFTADKFMWVPFVKNVPADTHMIAVDLPGHGDSDTPQDHMDISHMVTVERMKQLFERLNFDTDPVHIVGMSMGGALAGLYAANHPHHIHALTLICPAMKTPRESPFWRQLRESLEMSSENIHENCSLLFPTDASDVRNMLDTVQYHKMWVPTQILQGVAEWRKRYYPFYARLFQTIADPKMHDLLKSELHRIQAPTQVVWGEEDKIIDFSGAETLRAHLPNCVQVDIIPRCGHSMSTDRPGAMTKAILTFRRKVLQ